MKPSHTILAILLAAGAAARAQVVPDVNGPMPLSISGTLHYDVRYSQTAAFYAGASGNRQSSILSGELTYSTLNSSHPSSVTYSGGDIFHITGGSAGGGAFQHLGVTQGFSGRSWHLNFSDNVRYSPQAPTIGFSGIPGVGSLPQPPSEGGQQILTRYGRSVYNTFSPGFTHVLNHATTFSINGSYGIIRFPDGNGLEMNQYQAGPQISRRLNALSSISGEYSFSHISYPGDTTTMGTQSAQFGYQRTWSRRLGTSVMAGPEWIQSSNSAVIPSSTNITASADVTYHAGLTSATLSYSRAASGGAGVTTQIGVHHDDISADLSRRFGRNLTVSATGTFTRTQRLKQNGVTYGRFGGVSATERLSRSIVVFANYSAIQQSSSASLPSNAISGLSNVIGFGVGYSPREKQFKK